MNEERMKILEMLQEGKITPEESIKLLDAINNDDRSNNRNHNRHASHHNSNNNFEGNFEKNFERNYHSYEWIDDLRENIIESAKNFSDFITTQDFSFFDFNRPIETISYISKDLAQGINTITLSGKNDKIEVIGHDEDVIKVEVSYRIKNNCRPDIQFKDQDGNFAISFDHNDYYSLAIKIKIPKSQIKFFQVNTKNSYISIKDINFEKAEFTTKNSQITLKNVIGEDVFIQTKNAPILLNDVNITKILAKTINAKIESENTISKDATFKTTNASIQAKGGDIKTLLAVTNNAKMNFENIVAEDMQYSGKYKLEATTTNGSIFFTVAKSLRLPTKLSAFTTFGNIIVDMDDLITERFSQSCVDAKSADYDNVSRKLNLKLETLNGTIRVFR